jgi:hypothetical protein
LPVSFIQFPPLKFGATHNTQPRRVNGASWPQAQACELLCTNRETPAKVEV